MSNQTPQDPANAQDSESFADLFAASVQAGHIPTKKRSAHLGDAVQGTVVRVGNEYAFVDIGTKSEALWSLVDLRDASGNLRVQVGDRLEGRVTSVQTDGTCLLGNRLTRDGNMKSHLQTAFEQGIFVEGLVKAVGKAGLDVDLGGVRAFLPLSQVELHACQDPQSYIGRNLTLRITKYDATRNDVVVSRRAVLEAQKHQQVAHLQGQLVPGAVLLGTVTSVQEYGAFVDVGGIEGLVHVSELAHSRVNKAQDVVKPGQSVQVSILKVQPDATGQAGKISLSIKALLPNPVDAFLQQATIGQAVQGRVTKLESFGAFVEISPGVEALIPLSGLADHAIKHPRDVVQVGQEIAGVIVRLDPEKKHINVSLVEEAKQARVAAASALPLGEIISVVVERVEPYGVLVRIPGQSGGAEPKGLLPNAELGIDKRTDTKRQFPAGKQLRALVQRVETSGRVVLSLKEAVSSEEKASLATYSQDKNAGKATLGDLLRGKLPLRS